MEVNNAIISSSLIFMHRLTNAGMRIFSNQGFITLYSYSNIYRTVVINT